MRRCRAGEAIVLRAPNALLAFCAACSRAMASPSGSCGVNASVRQGLVWRSRPQHRLDALPAAPPARRRGRGDRPASVPLSRSVSHALSGTMWRNGDWLGFARRTGSVSQRLARRLFSKPASTIESRFLRPRTSCRGRTAMLHRNEGHGSEYSRDVSRVRFDLAGAPGSVIDGGGSVAPRGPNLSATAVASEARDRLIAQSTQ